MIVNNKFRHIKLQAKDFSVMFVDDKLIDITENNNSDYLLDAIFNSKRVMRTIDATKEKEINNILKEMQLISKIKEQKFYSEFPKTKLQNKKIKYDKELENIDIKYLCDKVIELNKTLLNHKMIISTQSELSYNNNIIDFNAKDFNYKNQSANLTFQIELIMKNKSDFTSYFAYDFFRKKDIDFNKIKNDIFDRIELIKDPITFNNDPKNYILLFEPKVVRSLVNYFIIMLSSLDSKMKKESYLANSKFDNKINIYEDPFVDYSPYSGKLDLDFINTSKKYLIKNGKPVNYITDLNNAFKYNKKSTGNNLLGAVTNLFFVNGKISKDKLIAKYPKIIVITNIIGIHTTNNKEGALNLSATGIEYHKGKRVNAIKDIKLNEKIQDLFKNVEISKETKWIGNYNLPYLLCKRGK